MTLSTSTASGSAPTRLAVLLIAALASTPGCGEPTPALDGGTLPGSDAGGADGGSTGADAAGSDAGGAPTDGGGTCAPTPGGASSDAYCDLFELAVFTFDDAAPEARLFGRVSPDGVTEGSCAVVDEVEVQRSGASIGTLAGAGAFATGAQSALLARGAPLAEMTMRCAGDAERFGGFGFVVRGRIDGGTFEARCADAEGGGRWPPAVSVTCHHNALARPVASYAMVSAGTPFSSTTFSTYLPHPPGPGASAVETSVHVIPGFASGFGPPPPMLDPFDAGPFTVSLSEGTLPGTTTATTSASFFATEVRFPVEICPPPSTGPPGPGDPLPPVFLARIRGAGPSGAFSTEAYVNYCITTSSP